MGNRERRNLRDTDSENKPCFYMHATLKQTKLFFLSMVMVPFLLAVFVAVVAGFYIRSAFEPVIAILSDSAVDPSATPEPSFPFAAAFAVACLLFLGTMFVWSLMTLRKAIRSSKAIERCSQNGTVIIEPPNSLAIVQYLYSKVVVDLSRTDFANYEAEDFPIEQIHSLTEVRIRESNIPDSIILKLARCKSLKRIDLSKSAISNDSADRLCQLNGVEFVLDEVAEQSEVAEIVCAELDES